jgi:hypothetical protein
MQQEKIQLENSEETFTLDNTAPEVVEPLPYIRQEIIFTMIGVLCVVFLAMLDQTIPLMAMLFYVVGGNRKPGLGAQKCVKSTGMNKLNTNARSLKFTISTSMKHVIDMFYE